MGGQESARPLLSDQDVITAWEDQEIDSESAERIGTACNVEQMFEEHPHDVLKFLQTSGVEKLAEFTAEVGVASKIKINKNPAVCVEPMIYSFFLPFFLPVG